VLALGLGQALRLLFAETDLHAEYPSLPGVRFCTTVHGPA